MPVSALFQRDYLLRLPLPLAQLYSRAFNAKDTRSRHDNGYYLFEAMLKLACCPAIGFYAQGLRLGQTRRDAKVDGALRSLALPSLGQWLAILRTLAKYFEDESKAHNQLGLAHPFAQLQNQVARRRAGDEAPAMLALYNRIAHGPDEKPGTDTGCSLLQLFDRLVQYRNAVVGHGGPRFEDFYEREMGPLIFPALNEILAEGFFDTLGGAGASLVYLTEMRMINMQEFEVSYRELTGLQGERATPLRIGSQSAAQAAPHGGEFQGLAVMFPNQEIPVRLSPMLRFRESEVADEVLFLNRDRGGKQVEYLSYTTGRTERDAQTTGELTALLKAVEAGSLESPTPMVDAEDLTLDVEANAKPHGRIVGDCELLAEVGRGGMGEVWLARQFALGRLVALKQLPRSLAENPKALARFHREVRLLGNCEHPNIIKLIGTGRADDGSHYYTMEYVAGADLDEVMRELRQMEENEGILSAQSFDEALWRAAQKNHTRLKERFAAAHRTSTRMANMGADTLPLPAPVRPNSKMRFAQGVPVVREVVEVGRVAGSAVGAIAEHLGLIEEGDNYTRRIARLIREAALALDAVHEQGIVHRDVSPSNLMVALTGRVVLMDFGLAKAGEASMSISQDGGFLGKIRYAAPEQLASSLLEIGPAADVRALGVVAWELLTRQRLFAEANDERQLATMIHQKDVPLLRTVDKELDMDLEAIVARATERDVSKRISSAGQLAEYLRMYLDGEVLPIRPPSTRELAARWVVDHKPLLLIVSIALTTVLVFGIVSFVQVVGERNRAEVAAKNEDKARQKAEDALRQLQEESLKAEHNLQLSRATISSLLSTVTHSPAFRGKGVYGPQRELLSQIVEQLEEFRRQGAVDEQLTKDLASARLTLCEAALALGELKEAEEQGQQAYQLLVGQPSQTVRFEQARVRTLLAQIHLQKREVDLGLEVLRRAPLVTDLLEPFIVEFPDNTDYSDAQVTAFVCMARLLALKGDSDSLNEAVERISRAQRVLADRRESDMALIARRSDLYLEKATLRRQLNNADQALDMYDRVIQLLQPFYDKLQASAPMRANYGIALRERYCLHLNDLTQPTEDFENRRTYLQRATSLLQSASEESSGVLQYQLELSKTHLALLQLELAQKVPEVPIEKTIKRLHIDSVFQQLSPVLFRLKKDIQPGRDADELQALSKQRDELENQYQAKYK